ILEAVAGSFGTPSGEITLEANPNDITPACLTEWRALGITRLSLGVQSLDDTALRFLGRDHTGEQARIAVRSALEVFPNTSLDLIYARPGQTLAAWQAELSAALAFGAPHLSLYELTIEARTAFGRRAARGELVPMEEDGQADLYELTQQICAAAGLPAYEISNHARAPEFQSRHNRVYWNSGDWLGLGPGAHGRLTIDDARMATVSYRRPAEYIAGLKAGESGWQQEEHLDAAQTGHELLAMGLRVAEGLELARLERLVGLLDAMRLGRLEEDGLILRKGSKLALTAQGRLLADHVAAQILI
ncbi:MAG: coproporphyrinogen III oxidase, partial [Hyphomonadaceae bacterium]|nr:coproporphyrinogen III oxidase [Hyphomonadaceae bacterium]